ncbi:MFS transporter [Luteimicrobium sp. NPDC057192]|uniref:MFS transporter n=1 Tax=Luteimicrobium sp. NPDC057192 TaxID=3346042 RepID=UPI003642FE74
MTTTDSSPTTTAVPVDPRRWWALAAVATAQLMVGLDLTIMNIALPSAQRDLGFADADRQWVITAFALGYGGLLLVGGRLSEAMGRRRALLVGAAGFAVASVAGGLATDTWMLLAARAAQGAFGALMTPSVLATLSTSFPVAPERGKAFGVYGTVMGSSSGIGLVLGGLLTQYLDWRWCMFVNVVVAAIAIGLAAYAVRPVPPARRPLDVPGAVLASLGLLALVYGFARAETDGWRAGVTVGSLALGAVVLVAFVVVEARVPSPLLPLRVVRDRRRGGSYLAVLSLAVGIFAALFFLTFFLQDVRGWSPVRTGLGFLPFTVGLMAGVRFVSPRIGRSTAVLLLPSGLLVIAAGLGLLGALHPDSGYWTHVMPVFLLVGAGAGWVLVTANSTATLGAGPDTAVAGAMVMTSQQVGASLGTALLSTVAADAASSYLARHPASGLAGVVHGFGVASWSAAGMLVAMAAVVFLVLPRRAVRAA